MRSKRGTSASRPLRRPYKGGTIQPQDSNREESIEDDSSEEAVENEMDSEPNTTEGGDRVFAGGRFHDLGLSASLADYIHDKMGFTAPTYIQQTAIPLVLSGRDVLVNAGTGTGKTIVYLAPIIHALQASTPRVSRNDGTFALVLVPTRELCVQVCGVAEQLLHRFHWLVPGCVMGGEKRSKEKARLRKGINILVATPGRLLDHLSNTSSFRRECLRWLVFDEADRLLDLGFEKDIESILSLLGSRNSAAAPQQDQSRHGGEERQHVLLSATLNERVEKLASLSLSEPATVGLDSTIPAKDISQKLETGTGQPQPADGYTDALQVATCCLVGAAATKVPRPWFMQDRTETFHQFGSAKSAVLLCTDVAARGLDFQGVSGIVQYDPPGDAAEYVHRVGRTARLGQKGEAVLFLQPSEKDYLQDLLKHGVSLKELPVRQLLDGLQSRRVKRDDAWMAVEMHPAASLMQNALEAFVAGKTDARQLAVDAFRSYVRAYAAHRGDLKSIFQVRKLHLGHVAKSFGLRDAPSLFGKSINKQALKREKEREVQKRVRKKRRLTPAVMVE